MSLISNGCKLVFLLLLNSCWSKSIRQQKVEEKILVSADGISKAYYIKDKLLKLTSYKSDSTTLHGKNIIYNINGIDSIECYSEGRKCGSTFYYEEGNKNPIKYVCYDSYGSLILQREYKDNKIVNQEGEYKINGLLYPINKEKKTVWYTLFMPRPPHVSVTGSEFIIDVSNPDVLIYPKNHISECDWIYYTNFELPKYGKYKYIINVEVHDSLSIEKTLLYNDTIVFEI